MIREENIVKIGNFIKTHGVKGELSLVLQNDLFEKVDPKYIICDMDGILVPFFVESYRFTTGDSLFITLADIGSDLVAKQFVKKEVFLENKQLGDEGLEEVFHYSWATFIGYTLIDQNDESIGPIIDIDESTVNTLFLVKVEDEELMFPAQDELIEWVDEEKKVIKSYIPEGLLELL